MKAKCIICRKSFEVYNLFCLRSGRGANSNCLKNGCPLACRKCLKKLKDTLNNLNL